MIRTLHLAYTPPYDFAALLAFFAKRAIPGVETVDATSYRRVFALDGAVGSLEVTALPETPALQLRVDADGEHDLADIAARVRRMFDLDADPATINAALSKRALLKRCVTKHPGQRLPGGWDGFEIAVRAVLGQQVTVAAARTLTERVVHKFGEPVQAPRMGKVHLFPSPQTLATADLSGLGITGARMRTLREVAQALGAGRVAFDRTQPLETFIRSWTALPGIGDWTAHYLAMRGMSHVDAFPAGDIVLRKAVARDGAPVAASALEEMSQIWRPYRAYAVLHLWRSTM
jgi:AraC family transcriptional regulator, regulatory protein of adaptative response / DNA-3-methyladenine glycosylase II